MSSPLISIIVPVYNVERYLGKCLESLTSQTFDDIEVICIDDGSTDSSPRLLDAAASRDSRIRVFHRENGGVARARNIGMEYARGSYFLFVDSDDYIAARTCELLGGIAVKEKADIVVFGGKTFPTLDWADRAFACRDTIRHNGLEALLYERGSIPLMCNKLYSSSFVSNRRLRFSEDLILGEDHAFHFVAFPLAKTVAFTHEVLYFYRVRPDSAFGSNEDNAARRLYLYLDVVKYALGAWGEAGLLEEHASEGVSWATSFLYDAASLTYHNERVQFAKVFGSFLHSLLGERRVESLDLNDDVRLQLRYLLSSQDDEGKPSISVLVECADEADDAKAALDAIEFQDEQSFEVLFFPPVDEGSRYAELVADFTENDCRARVLPTRDVSAALQNARGTYLLRAYANVVYDPQAFDQLLQLAGEREGRTVVGEREPYDIAVFADSAGMLGVRDLFDFYEPSTTEAIVPEGAHPASDFSSQLFSFSSIASANKAFNREFLLQCSKEAKCSTWLGLQCAALARAEKIVVTKRPLATLRCLPFESTGLSGARAMFDDVFSGFEEVRANFAGDDKAIRGLDAAAARHLILMADLIRNPIARRYCFEDARERGGEAVARALADTQLTDAERVACKSLLGGTYDAYTGCRDAIVLNDVIMKNEENLLAVGGQAQHINQLNSDIEEFYHSISYRTGRAVTAPARAAANLAKRVLHAVHRG